MDAKQLKAKLKIAKEAIKNKDFQNAVDCCQSILQVDESHYNALVFLSVSLEGLKRDDEALATYKKATLAEPMQLLAWQGLCRYLEKSTLHPHKEELLSVYDKLLELIKNDAAKSSQILFKKGFLLVELSKFAESVPVLEHVLDESLDATQKMSVMQQITDVLDRDHTLRDTHQALYEQCLQRLIMCDDLTQQDKLVYWQRQITALYQHKGDPTTLLQTCKTMHNIYPDCVKPIDILCQQVIEMHCLEDNYDYSNDAIIDSVLQHEADSTMYNVCRSYIALWDNKYTAALPQLKAALQTQPDLVCGWVGLAKLCTLLHHHQEAIETIKKATSQLESSSSFWLGPNQSLVQQKLRLFYCDVIIDCQDQEQMRDTASQLLQDPSLTSELYERVALLKLNLAQYDIEDELQHIDNGDVVKCIQGYQQLVQGDLVQAEASLENSTHCYHKATYWLAVVRYKLCEQNPDAIEKTHDTIVEAVRRDQHDALAVLLLGQYYQHYQQDNSKALRCYQRAFKLNSEREDIGVSLCDLLMTMQDHETLFEVLSTVTSKLNAHRVKWAWLRLGLYHLHTGDATAAISALQATLKTDLSDRQCWECLGDAYKARGSHSAAIKAYTKATTLDSDSTYCFYQIASIQQTLGLYSEAVEGYTGILDKEETYVPALSGLGETYLQLAHAALRECLFGRAVAHCQLAIINFTKAVYERSDMTCLWKHLADCCTVLHALPEQLIKIAIPTYLLASNVKDRSETKAVTKAELLDIGARCYSMAVKQKPDCSDYYHDLGLTYFYQAQCTSTSPGTSTGSNTSTSGALACKAVKALHKALGIDPTCAAYWNTLGIVSASAYINHPALAQHCFIKSVQCAENVSAWTNLGALYLKNGNNLLAHEAFKTAQSLDPTYVQAWIGQALIAETMGNEDAMDLFRHTTELGYHDCGAIGYASMVCATLQDSHQLDQELLRYSIEEMCAVPAACDALVRYTALRPDDATAHNMLGLLLEKQGLYRQAVTAFTRSRAILEQCDEKSHLVSVTINLARSMCEYEMYEESISTYSQVSDSLNYRDKCYLAKAHYGYKQYQQAIQCYTAALEADDSEPHRSEILTALGVVCYVAGDVDVAKTHLFAGSQMDNPCQRGLLVLCTVGLLHKDTVLANAVMEEVNKIPPEQYNAITREEIDRVMLVLKAATEGLSAGIDYLLSSSPTRDNTVIGTAIKMSDQQPHCLHKLTKLVKHSSPCTQASKMIHVLYCLLLGYHDCSNLTLNSYSAAQHAVHMYPDELDNWYNLLAATLSDVIVRDTRHKLDSAVMLASTLLAKAESELSKKKENAASLQQLHLWTVKIYLLLLIENRQMDKAKQFIQQALWLYDEDSLLKAINYYILGDTKGLSQLAEQEANNYIWQLLFELLANQQRWDDLAQCCLKAADLSSDDTVARDSAQLKLAFVMYKQLVSKSADPSKHKDMFNNATRQVTKHNRHTVNVLKGLMHIHDKQYKLAKKCLLDSLDDSAASNSRLDTHNLLVKRALLYVYNQTQDTEAAQKLKEDIAHSDASQKEATAAWSLD